jgi:hypothetical protein
VVSASKINTNFDTLYTLVNGNLDDSNISSLSASKIGYDDGIFIFSTTLTDNSSTSTIRPASITRTSADALCSLFDFKIKQRTCSNVRAYISISSADEIRDMVSNYSVPENSIVYNKSGLVVADNFSKLYDGSDYSNLLVGDEDIINYSPNSPTSFWVGTDQGGAISQSSWTCTGWSTNSDSVYGSSQRADYSRFYAEAATNSVKCGLSKSLLCLCY